MKRVAYSYRKFLKVARGEATQDGNFSCTRTCSAGKEKTLPSHPDSPILSLGSLKKQKVGSKPCGAVLSAFSFCFQYGDFKGFPHALKTVTLPRDWHMKRLWL